MNNLVIIYGIGLFITGIIIFVIMLKRQPPKKIVMEQPKEQIIDVTVKKKEE